jgi:hypothetical protein
MADGNGDQPDVEEDSSWSCPFGCGAGGSCVAGDEMIAVAVHLGSCPNNTDE